MTLIIGVGNAWRRDDAAGLEVARLLGGVELEGEPLGLLEAWEGEREAVVVDAVSSGAEPGTIHRFDALAGPLPARAFCHSTHALGLAEAIELGRALGRLPERLEIYGIEGGRFEAGSGLSPAVAAAVQGLVADLGRAVLRASEPPRG